MTYQVGDKVRVRRKLDSGAFVVTITDWNDDDTFSGTYRAKGVVQSGTFRKARISSYARSNSSESSVKGTPRQWAKLYADADAAGRKAADAATPVPMLVGTPKNMLASLVGRDDGGFDEKEPVYYVSDGVCGFAWVLVRPGNSSFARWLAKTDKGSAAYGGGVSIWVSGYGQSMQRKEAYAGAFAKVLQDAGITAYSQSRMD